jgi:hypothetical protein
MWGFCVFEQERFEDRDKTSRSRYNGRQFLSWLQDVGDKYDNIKVNTSTYTLSYNSCEI